MRNAACICFLFYSRATFRLQRDCVRKAKIRTCNKIDLLIYMGDMHGMLNAFQTTQVATPSAIALNTLTGCYGFFRAQEISFPFLYFCMATNLKLCVQICAFFLRDKILWSVWKFWFLFVFSAVIIQHKNMLFEKFIFCLACVTVLRTLIESFFSLNVSCAQWCLAERTN